MGKKINKDALARWERFKDVIESLCGPGKECPDQQSLADTLKIPPPTLSRYMSTETDLKSPIVWALEARFRINFDYVWSGAEPQRIDVPRWWSKSSKAAVKDFTAKKAEQTARLISAIERDPKLKTALAELASMDPETRAHHLGLINKK